MDRAQIMQLAGQDPGFREKLFIRGFLLTDGAADPSAYPFFGRWKTERCGGYTLFVSPEQTFFRQARGETEAVLVGHAYDPFTMTAEEPAILAGLLDAFSPEEAGRPDAPFWEKVNGLTGVFTLLITAGGALYVIGDAAGMQTVFYTAAEGKTLVATHTNLIGDLLGLGWDPYVRRLTRYRFFRLLGNSLPGDLTQFADVKRLTPNHCVKISGGQARAFRFYTPRRLEAALPEIAERVSGLLHANMELIARKWNRPAISLTGGCDSKTTLACAAGLYDRFICFSYDSAPDETPDAEAAHTICGALGLEHTIYRIPGEDWEPEKTRLLSEAINWNTGDIRYSHAHDVRKRLFFFGTKDFDVEVKSWASEIGRAYYSKRFAGRTDFGPMTPRRCTTLYKFFLNDRGLVRETDRVFRDYMDRLFRQDAAAPVEWQDQFFWEFRAPSWNGLDITGDHRVPYDITIPYNNRRILELLLSAPIRDRYADTVYTMIRARMDPAIDATGIAVTDLRHTSRRAKAENLYYALHSRFPL